MKRKSKYLAITAIILLLNGCKSVSRTNTTDLSPSPITQTPTVASYTPKLISTFTQEPPSTFTPTASPTITPTPKLYKLSFQAFHDYNGNGSMEEGEPVLGGILIKIKGSECKTDIDGNCEISDFPSGRRKLTIYDQRDVEPYKKMRFILPSLSEVRTLAQGLFITIDGDNKIMVPLGHGYLTWPLNCINKGAVTAYYDVLKGPGCKYWNTQSIPGYICENEHGGIDIAGSLGLVIVASAPGTVRTGHNNNGALWVDVTVKNTSYIDLFGHVEEYLVSTGELVKRGQPIALLGDTGGTYPHIHFAIFSGGEEAFDPYRNLFDYYSRSLWTVDNEPQCLPTE